MQKPLSTMSNLANTLRPSWWGNGPHRKISFVVFVILAYLDHVAIGIIPPLYEILSRNFSVGKASIGLVTALSFLLRGITSVLWGYFGDRLERKWLILLGTIVWSGAMFLTGASHTFAAFISFQIVASLGFGCIDPLGLSVVGDVIPPQRRGIALSLWGLAQSMGLGSGLLLAGFLGALNWRAPFTVIAGVGLGFSLLYIFTYKPERGRMEPELTNVFTVGGKYQYKIELSDIPNVFNKPSNIWLILAYMTMRFSYGTYVWLPALFMAKVEADGYSIGIATLVGSLFTGIFSIGNYLSVFAGHFGDLLQKRDLRGRLKICSLGVLGSIPFYIGLFILPLHGLNIPDQAGAYAITIWILKSILTNGWVAGGFLFSIGAVALSSIPLPNWSASVSEVNLPENRGTVFGVCGLLGGFGAALGNGAMGVIFTYLGIRILSPWNYILGFTLLQISSIPLSLFFYKATKNAVQDILETKRILRERVNIT